MKRLAAVSAALVFGVVAAGYARGGWAVVTIRNPPDYLTVGTPNDLTFEIRAHGRVAIAGIQTAVEASNGSGRVTGRTWETRTPGVYRATLNVPSAGAWRVRITTNVGHSRAETLPWRAVAPGERVVALTDTDRGRQLFASRGCVTCHVHAAVDVRGQMSSFGPDLSRPRYAASYVARFLADPSIKPRSADGRRMPNPGLEEKEIAALVAFLTERREQVAGNRD